MKTQTLSIPVSVEIASFAQVLEAKLQSEGLDDAKTWTSITPARIVRQLARKVDRLQGTTDPAMLFTLAIAVGNLAVILADQAGEALESAETIELSTAEAHGAERLSVPVLVPPFRHRVKTALPDDPS
jgi:hypothetical protein